MFVHYFDSRTFGGYICTFGHFPLNYGWFKICLNLFNRNGGFYLLPNPVKCARALQCFFTFRYFNESLYHFCKKPTGYENRRWSHCVLLYALHLHNFLKQGTILFRLLYTIFVRITRPLSWEAPSMRVLGSAVHRIRLSQTVA